MRESVLRRFQRTLSVGLLVLGAAACASVEVAPAQSTHGEPKYGRDKFIRVRGHTLHCVEAGAGRPVLLVPGAFTTYRAWDRVLAGLSPHRRVLAVDYLGVGDSDKPKAGFRYTVEEQADLLAEMIAELNLAPVTLVGASYGGAVALNVAARHAHLVGQVVSIEGGALITPEALNYNRLGALLDWPILGEIIWGFMQSGLFDEITARSIMGQTWNASAVESSARSWASCGQISRRFETHRPAVEVVRVEGGIHDLHLQYPDVVAGLVLRFSGMAPGGDVVARGVPAPTDDLAADGVVR